MRELLLTGHFSLPTPRLDLRARFKRTYYLKNFFPPRQERNGRKDTTGSVFRCVPLRDVAIPLVPTPIFCWRTDARARKVYESGVPLASPSLSSRHRLYDRRIYTIVGLYTWKLLTYATFYVT